jgi:putative FmdB family regulatory protein
VPLYEYKCTKCGTVFEIFQKVNDPAPKKCSKCLGPLKKVLSPPALKFKGSGWYVTDYGGKKGSASEPSSEKSPKKGKEPSKDKEKDMRAVSEK